MRQQKAEREKAEQKASELAELDQLMREEAEFEAVRGGGGVRASTSPESSSAPASQHLLPAPLRFLLARDAPPLRLILPTTLARVMTEAARLPRMRRRQRSGTTNAWSI